MLKFVFDLITSQFSLFENTIYNYIAMGIVGSIALTVALTAVGDLGFKGILGSITHWTIRFIVFVVVWFIFLVVINVIKFIKNNLISIIICIILSTVFYILKKYAESRPNCVLNKKII